VVRLASRQLVLELMAFRAFLYRQRLVFTALLWLAVVLLHRHFGLRSVLWDVVNLILSFALAVYCLRKLESGYDETGN